MMGKLAKKDRKKEDNFKAGFQHAVIDYFATVSTSTSFAHRNPTVMSCRHGFAWKRLDERTFRFVSRQEPPRMIRCSP